MFRRATLTILLAIMCLTTYSQEVEPLLFADTSILDIELHYNFDELKRDYDSDPNYHSARLRYKNIWGGMSRIDVEIKTRGIFRRNPKNCSQPPLWLRFNSKDVRNTPFEGIGKIKLVLQCYDRSSYDQLLLKEFLAYKIYSIVSPNNYKVRIARVTQIDRITNNKIVMYGFFIEPADMMTSRLKGRLDDRKNIHPNACNKSETTRMAIFQYMIGHTDWSIKALHNITLIEPADAAPPIPVPFDFDFSGIVDAPYALPAEHLPIKSVRERYFNGYCRSLEEFKVEVDYFNSKKEEIIDCIKSFYLIDAKNRSRVIDYINEFYDIINDDKMVKKEFIEGCRTD